MDFSPNNKALCVRWFIQSGDNYKAFQTKFRSHFGIHSKPPDIRTMKAWVKKFEAGEGQKRKKRTGVKVS